MSFELKSLSDLVELQRGHDLPSHERMEGSVPVIGSFGVTGWHNVERYSGPGVAIGRSGSIGTATYVDEGFWPLNTCLFVRDFKGNDPRWVYWMLHGLDFMSYNSGSAQPSLNRNNLADIKIATPGLSQQRSISGVLGVFDDKIAANRRLVESIDNLIRSRVASRPVKSIQLWEAMDFVFGEAFKGDSFSAPGIGRPLVRIRDLKSQKCQVWTTERRARECEVRPGDILVGMDAEFRPTRWSGPEGVLNQRVLSASSDTYGPAIALEMLVAPLRRIERSKTGTTVIHLNKSDLLAEEVLAPVGLEVPALRALVDPMWERAVAAEQESVRLAATRDELLPLLMSGKITVKDAEKTVEEVV